MIWSTRKQAPDVGWSYGYLKTSCFMTGNFKWGKRIKSTGLVGSYDSAYQCFFLRLRRFFGHIFFATVLRMQGQMGGNRIHNSVSA